MTVLVIAPHPDDETLGAGGTLLRHKADGENIHWLIATSISTELGYDTASVERRQREIERVSLAYGFTSVHAMELPSTRLDTMPLGDIIGGIAKVIQDINPETVYIPFPGDAHTDHRIVFEASIACTKSFRYPCIRRVAAMEIISETNFGLNPAGLPFQPNLFVDISKTLDKKIEIMGLYEGEMGTPPFPRSERSIRALAHLRGDQANAEAAEAFQILKDIR